MEENWVPLVDLVLIYHLLGSDIPSWIGYKLNYKGEPSSFIMLEFQIQPLVIIPPNVK